MSLRNNLLHVRVVKQIEKGIFIYASYKTVTFLTLKYLLLIKQL